MSIARPFLLLGAGAMTIAALTGCTSSPHTTGPSVVDPLVPNTAGSLNALPAATTARVATNLEVADDLSLPWKFIEFGADHRTIQVVYAQGDGWCVLPVGFSAQRVHHGVVLTAVSRSTGHQVCPSVVQVARAWVHLPAAISGGTKLEHAPVAHDWGSPNLLG